MRKICSIVLCVLVSLPQVYAQASNIGGDDFMRQTGKIYVVVAVIVLVLLGLLLLLLRLDKRLSKLENQILPKKNGRS